MMKTKRFQLTLSEVIAIRNGLREEHIRLREAETNSSYSKEVERLMFRFKDEARLWNE